MNNESILWGAADHFIYAPLILLVGFLLGYLFFKRKRAVSLLADGVLRNRFIVNYSPVKSAIKSALFLVGFIFLFIAFLRPQWHKKEEQVAQEGRDLFIALDVSRSMLCTDLAPNRLAFAKQKIKQLLNNLSCERVGLILFAGSTFIQCPLTDDYNAFFMFLDQIDGNSISSGTTAVDQAIKKALESFKSLPAHKNKLLVLFTDGEDFSHNLGTIKQDAAQEGMHIFAFGIGSTQGAPVPLFDVQGNQIGHQKDSKGGIVISRLNESMLSNLARDSGGMYLHAQLGASDIKQVVRAVGQFEKEKFDDKKIVAYEEQYPYFIAVSFVCLLIEWLL